MEEESISFEKLPIEILTKIHRFIGVYESEVKLHQVNRDLYYNFETRSLIMTSENTQKRVCKVPEKTSSLQILENVNCEAIKLNSDLKYLEIHDNVSPDLFNGMILPDTLSYYYNLTEHNYRIFFPRNIKTLLSKELYSHYLFGQKFFISPPSLNSLKYEQKKNKEKIQLILSDKLEYLIIQNPVEVITCDKFIDKVYSGEEITENDLIEANNISNKRLPKNLEYIRYVSDVNNIQILKDIIELSKGDKLTFAICAIDENVGDISIGNVKLGKNITTFYIKLSNIKDSIITLNDVLVEFCFLNGIIKDKLPKTILSLITKKLVNIRLMPESLGYLFLLELDEDIILNKKLDFFAFNKINKNVDIKFNDNLKVLEADMSNYDKKLILPKYLKVLILYNYKVDIRDLPKNIQFLKIDNGFKNCEIPDTVRILVGKYKQTHYVEGKLPRDVKVITKLPKYVPDRKTIKEGFITINDKQIYYDKSLKMIKQIEEEIKIKFNDSSVEGNSSVNIVIKNIVELNLS